MNRCSHGILEQYLDGLLSRGQIDECGIGNADETHFVINVDNGGTLGFPVDNEIKHTDMVSGGEEFTMLVRLSGGRDALIELPFMVFRNVDRNYFIKGVPDDFPGVDHRTRPKGWMDTTEMPLWCLELVVIRSLAGGRKRVLFIDNCSGHTMTEARKTAAASINSKVCYFPPNFKYLIQPRDSFIIKNIKRTWSTHWENHKLSMIRARKWKDSCGKIHNSGKLFFESLAAR